MTLQSRVLAFWRMNFEYLFGRREQLYLALLEFVENEVKAAIKADREGRKETA